MTRLHDEKPRNGVSISGRRKMAYRHQNVQTDSRNHTASYSDSMGTLSQGIERLGRVADQTNLSRAKFKNTGTVTLILQVREAYRK